MKSLLNASVNRLLGGGYHKASLESAEQLFLAPPFTEEVVGSVRRISTRLSLNSDEASRMLWQRESNAASQSEYDALSPVFARMARPGSILEIGPGFGRSVAFFGKKGVWDATAAVHLYDATGEETKYKQKHYDRPPKWPDISSFCGDLAFLRECLEYNHIGNYQIHDAALTPLRSLPGPFDLIYAFYSVGFHWSLDYYLDELEPLLHEKSVMVCTLNKHFKMSERLREFWTEIIEVRDLKRSSQPERLMVLSRTPLPERAVDDSLGSISKPLG